MDKIIERVAGRFLRVAVPNLRGILKDLDDLEELSENIEDEIDTFSLHFRVAGVDTDVGSQFSLLKKAMAGLEKAKAAKSSLMAIAESFPEDKTAKRALKDAEVMIKRFERLEEQSRKVIGQLSKKDMPPALKKYASSIVNMLKRKVVDPKTINVKAWQNRMWRTGVIYQMVIFVDTGEGKKRRFELEQNTGKRDGPVFGSSISGGKPLSPKEAVSKIVESLAGWSGLKSEQGVDRSGTARAVADAINSAMRSMSYHGFDEAVIENNNMVIYGSYRSDNIPKYDAHEYAVEREEERFEKVLRKKLGPLMSEIKNIYVSHSEKSWVTGEVRLK